MQKSTIFCVLARSSFAKRRSGCFFDLASEQMYLTGFTVGDMIYISITEPYLIILKLIEGDCHEAPSYWH